MVPPSFISGSGDQRAACKPEQSYPLPDLATQNIQTCLIAFGKNSKKTIFRLSSE